MKRYKNFLIVGIDHGYPLQTPPSVSAVTDNPGSEDTDFSAIDLDFIGG